MAAVAILAQRRLRVPAGDRRAVAESKYARTLSDWGAPSWFPLKWQWVQVTRFGRSRWGISLTSKWQSAHTFFACTDPASVSPVTKRSRICPSTSNLRNSGFPWHRVHFSSEIEAEASRADPGEERPPEKDQDRRERELPHKSPSSLSFSYSSGCSSRSHSADTFPVIHDGFIGKTEGCRWTL